MKVLPKERVAYIIIFFIMFQPLIDILTTFSIYILNTDATFGIVIRLFYMFIVLLFSISLMKEDPLAKLVVPYILTLLVFSMINLSVNYFYKDNFMILQEIKFIVKTMYFQVVFGAYVLIFRFLKQHKEKLSNLFYKNLVNASIIIGSTMLISIVTNTSFDSYEFEKSGFSGWFFAANELAAIMAIIFPALAYLIFVSPKFDFYLWIAFLLLSFSLIMVGTKVGILSFFITIISAVLIKIINLLKNTHLYSMKRRILLVSLLSFSIVLLIIVTPRTSAFKNTMSHINISNVDQSVTKKIISGDITFAKEDVNNRINIQNIILSDRDVFLLSYKETFSKASIAQKYFGMGYGGNYKKEAKMIEIDYYDLYYSFGLIGFILYFAPLLGIISYLLLNSTKSKKTIYFPYYLLMISILLGFSIAYFSGHVFTAPSVSIYLAFILTYILFISGEKFFQERKTS